jgi:hypothetical protein
LNRIDPALYLITDWSLYYPSLEFHGHFIYRGQELSLKMRFIVYFIFVMQFNFILAAPPFLSNCLNICKHKALQLSNAELRYAYHRDIYFEDMHSKIARSKPTGIPSLLSDHSLWRIIQHGGLFSQDGHHQRPGTPHLKISSGIMYSWAQVGERCRAEQSVTYPLYFGDKFNELAPGKVYKGHSNESEYWSWRWKPKA